MLCSEVGKRYFLAHFPVLPAPRLRLLFERRDMSEIKRYCERQWSKILLHRFSLRDVVFRKEVRLGSYRGAGSAPPGARMLNTGGP